MFECLRSLRKDDSGAVAVTYALALTGLIAMAGVGFDYARMMTLDSELQSAADEAALAAATQLDGKAGAIARAKDAVNSYFANANSVAVNRTLMANDGAGSALTGVTFTFYTSFDSATDTVGAVTTADASAKVVRVMINSRRAFFALTPIVGLFNTGGMTADALAGLQTGTCKLPPLMICGPNGATDFPTSADIGTGIVMKVGSSGQWFPGNFGYVDFGNGGNTVKQLLGTNSAGDSCVPGVDLTTEPGNIASATAYLNTRFDIYQNPLTPANCGANGDYCPAASTRKDLVRKEMYTYKKEDSTKPMRARPACGSGVTTQTLPGGDQIDVTEWVPATQIPGSTAVEGFPRDSCHAAGTCGNIGNKVWNVAGYYASHPYLPGGLTTRYSIYKWERDNAATGLQPTRVATGTGDGVFTSCNGAGKNCTLVFTNYCSYPSPIKGTYHATPKDRRLLTVAVTDCTNANGGKKTLPVNKWMDVFLTEPSWTRTTPVTDSNEIYGEVASVATKPDGSNAFQYYSRNKAVLLQ